MWKKEACLKQSTVNWSFCKFYGTRITSILIIITDICIAFMYLFLATYIKKSLNYRSTSCHHHDRILTKCSQKSGSSISYLPCKLFSSVTCTHLQLLNHLYIYKPNESLLAKYICQKTLTLLIWQQIPVPANALTFVLRASPIHMLVI